MNYYEELGKINKKIERLQRCKANCGSTSSVVIEVTKAQFLALVSGNTLTFPAVYKITDVENGLFVETLSSNTFSPDATISLFVPNYTASGDNLGQMDFSSIPSVGVDEYVIWGDYYWKNNTASPITPTITDDVTLAGGFLTKLAKTSGSIYDILELECVVDDQLRVSSMFNALNNNSYSVPVSLLNFLPNKSYIYAQINAPFIINSDVTIVKNQLSDFNTLKVLNAFASSDLFVSTFSQNKGNINQCKFDGSNNNFSKNIGDFPAIKLVNNSRFTSNIVTGAKSSYPNSAISKIGYIELFDNCQMVGNELNGESSVIWDVRTGENCEFDSNIINSNAVASQHCGFNDINMMQFDEVNGNVLNGDDVIVEVINMLGYSKFNNNTFNGNLDFNSRFCGFQMLRSEITDNTMNSNFKYWRDIWMTDAKLRNATDIQVQNCTFEGIDLDLTGFTTDIIGQTIQSGKGWFAITRDFSTTPLVDGIPELHNIIPIGGYITSIKAKGNITSGTSLTIGLESDDTSLISQVVANYAAGQTYNGISAVATANRSLRLASVGDLNAGSVTILVEFMI